MLTRGAPSSWSFPCDREEEEQTPFLVPPGETRTQVGQSQEGK